MRVLVKLLSPPVPPNYNGERSHLVDYMPMLSGILYGASSVDTVHIFSLHGVVRLLYIFRYIPWVRGSRSIFSSVIV